MWVKKYENVVIKDGEDVSTIDTAVKLSYATCLYVNAGKVQNVPAFVEVVFSEEPGDLNDCDMVISDKTEAE